MTKEGEVEEVVLDKEADKATVQGEAREVGQDEGTVKAVGLVLGADKVKGRDKEVVLKEVFSKVEVDKVEGDLGDSEGPEGFRGVTVVEGHIIGVKIKVGLIGDSFEA